MVAHDNYEHEVDRMIKHLVAEARGRDIEVLQAFVASRDEKKRGWFAKAGMRVVATLRGEIKVQARSIDVLVVERHLH